MQANMSPSSGGRTFTEQARRAQIVAAAIDTIAEIGYIRASFARIAERAGLSSTGLISYHFSGKTELMEQVVSTVLGDMGGFMHERMRGHLAPTDALSTYIGANIDYVAAHRTEMKALLDIFMNGAFSYDKLSEAAVLSPIESILREGQERGEFRPFEVQVMAAVIQRAIDGLPFLLEVHPDLDLKGYAREVVTLFHRATRAEA